MTRHYANYLGRAGQLHLMSVLLERGWNVGIPDVDTGVDLVAHRPADANLDPIQVKTSRTDERRYGYSADFYVDQGALKTVPQSPAIYVFVVRFPDRWGPLLVIDQQKLSRLAVAENMGSPSGDTRSLYVRYHLADDDTPDQVLCSDSDLTPYLDDLSRWPRLDP